MINNISYSDRDKDAPTSTDVAGKVAPGLAWPFTVTVNGQPATVDDDGNFHRLGVALSAGENQITVQATDKYGRTDSELRTVTLAAAPVFSYDLNGNMTSDGVWNYSWNDENRMVEAEKSGTGILPVFWQKIQYLYDGLGRMRLMRAYEWDSDSWILTSETRFIYDGTRILAELDGSDSELRTYTWGIDIDGGLGTAGGVGGLLAVANSAGTYFPCYDGNGNVTAYVNTAGTVISETEYAPFGAVVSQTGTSFPFGFSTQYTAHGLVHYLYRKLNPEFDRWMSRDPIGEDGGYNLYEFVLNCPIDKYDYLGNIEIKYDYSHPIKGFPWKWLPEWYFARGGALTLLESVKCKCIECDHMPLCYKIECAIKLSESITIRKGENPYGVYGHEQRHLINSRYLVESETSFHGDMYDRCYIPLVCDLLRVKAEERLTIIVERALNKSWQNSYDGGGHYYDPKGPERGKESHHYRGRSKIYTTP